MRRTLLVLSALLATQAVAQQTDPVKGNPNIKGDITFLTNKSDVVKGMIPAFNKLYPNIKMTIAPVAAGDLRTKLVTLASANQMPGDVMQLEGLDLEFMVRRFPNLFADITPWAGKLKSGFSASQIQEGTINGKLYGLPIDNSTIALYYRADMFKKAGVNPTSIKTWDQYMAAAEKVMAANPGVKMTQLNAFKDDEFLRMLLQQTTGGSYFDKDGNIAIATPGAQKAYAQLKTMWDKKVFLDVQNVDTVVGALKANKIATFTLPAFWGDLLQLIAPEQKGLWGTMPLPGFGKSQPVDFVSSFLMIGKGSKNPLAAQAFVEWYATTGGQKRGQNPSTMNAYLPGADKLNLKNPYFANANYASPFLLGLKGLPYLRFTSDFNTARQASINTQGTILNGGNIAATLTKAASDIANQTGRTVLK